MEHCNKGVSSKSPGPDGIDLKVLKKKKGLKCGDMTLSSSYP